MKNARLKIKADLTALVEKAADFHGHLGPFLVLGIRIGLISLKELEVEKENSGELSATLELEPTPPISCIIDGIQFTTKCTIGNQKLKLNKAQGEITATFQAQNSNKALKIQVNHDMVEKLKKKLSEGTSCEELAWEVATIPSNQLFTMEKQ